MTGQPGEFERIDITGVNADTGATVTFHLTDMAEARRFALEVLAALPPVDATGGRYCVGCRHARKPTALSDALYCEHPALGVRNDPVYGRPVWYSAEGARMSSGGCGEAGKLWEPRTP